MNTLFPFMTTQSTDKVAKSFIIEAGKMIGLAEEEIRLGDVVSSLWESEKNDSLLSIALWHYDQGVKKMRIALGLLKQAKRLHLSEKYRAYVDLREKESRTKAKQAFDKKVELENLMEENYSNVD